MSPFCNITSFTLCIEVGCKALEIQPHERPQWCLSYGQALSGGAHMRAPGLCIDGKEAGQLGRQRNQLHRFTNLEADAQRKLAFCLAPQVHIASRAADAQP